MATDTPKGNFSFPTRYRIGAGRRAELAKEARTAKITRALVVTDPGVRALPWFSEMLSAAEGDGLTLTVFSDVKTNPTEANVDAGASIYKGNECDGVIAVGGGSAMDAGKAIAILAGHDGRVFDYEFAGGKWKNLRFPQVAPVLAMPTTAGTGSECSNGAVVTDVEDKVKRTFAHPALVPKAVIADPEVTLGLPPNLTAATGMDAVTHCLEAYCAPAYHPMADGVALEGLRLLAEYLPRAYADGSDIEARTHVLMASSMAAVAFQKGLGLVHAMAHPLGAVTDIHHGLSNAILLPYVMRVNRPAIESKMDLLARYLGLAPGFDGVEAWILSLRETLDIPPTLRGTAGIDSLDIVDVVTPKAAAEAMYLATNPRPVDEETIRNTYVAAIEGD